MRKISDYEKEWLGWNKEYTEYKGYYIFEYSGGFTFWYGAEDSEYISSIKTLDDAKKIIDKDINNA